jgi:protein-disulfide isomerase
MNRQSVVIVALVFALGAAVGYGWFAATNAPGAMSEADVRAIVNDELDQRDTTVANATPIDPDAIHPIIENYLLANPRILQQMSIALDAELRAEQRAQTKVALASMNDAIYADPANIVIGNPDGDVTLVEMFDYNCTYCRQSVPDVMQLLDEDPDLRVILKEFPILSDGSVDAARVGVLVAQADVDYLNFYTSLFSTRGAVDREAALSAASGLGLSRVNLELKLGEPDVTDVIQRNYALAQGLNITGTPTFILGDEIIRGAVGLEVLRQKIANVRDCGSTDCEG